MTKVGWEYEQAQLRLYENLFDHGDRERTLSLIEGALDAIQTNVTRLLDVCELMLQQDRYATASFFLVTADEEIAKSYILVDACRLDMQKHHNVLKGLCRAFYDHFMKHAYFRLQTDEFIDSMAQAWEFWRIEVKRWWPGSQNPEDGEPDLPSDVFMRRESTLYVDYDWIGGRFVPPLENSRKYAFEERWSELSKTRQAFERMRLTADFGLYDAAVLGALNDVFAPTYIRETTETQVIEGLYRTFTARLGRSLDELRASALCAWPLYHFPTVVTR